MNHFLQELPEEEEIMQHKELLVPNDDTDEVIQKKNESPKDDTSKD